MPEGSSESNFVQFKSMEPTPESLVTPEQLAATDTANARDLVEMAYGGTVAVTAETQPSEQAYIDAITPQAVTPGSIAGRAEQVVADTKVIQDATTIGTQLARLRAREISQDMHSGGYQNAA